MSSHPTRQVPSASRATLQYLGELWLRDPEEARRQYDAITMRRPSSRVFDRVVAGDAWPAFRTDIDRENDKIDYSRYGPVGWWGAPYTVVKAKFLPGHKSTDYIYHAGEEIMVPLGEGITYRFFCAKDGALERQDFSVSSDTVLRVNPSVPHHTWLEGDDAADAWMILRHPSNSPDAIALDNPAAGPPQRRVTEAELKEPGRYALIAWGISERIALKRSGPGLTIGEAASQGEIDASLLSRLESGKANIGLQSLDRIDNALKLDLDELIAPTPWTYLCADLKGSGTLFDRLAGIDIHDRRQAERLLYPAYLEVPANTSVHGTPDIGSSVDGGAGCPSFSSWIVLSGSVLFKLPTESGMDPALPNDQLVQTGSVIHFRERLPLSVGAIGERKARIFRVDYFPTAHYSMPEMTSDEN